MSSEQRGIGDRMHRLRRVRLGAVAKLHGDRFATLAEMIGNLNTALVTLTTRVERKPQLPPSQARHYLCQHL